MEENFNLSDEVKKELDRRLERHRSGEAKYYTLHEVRKMLAEKRKKNLVRP